MRDRTTSCQQTSFEFEFVVVTKIMANNVVCLFHFQKAKKLNVFKNDDETWDYTGALNNNSGLWS